MTMVLVLKLSYLYSGKVVLAFKSSNIRIKDIQINNIYRSIKTKLTQSSAVEVAAVAMPQPWPPGLLVVEGVEG